MSATPYQVKAEGPAGAAPYARGSTSDTCTETLIAEGSPVCTGVNHTEGQVFQYTIDLNEKKRKKRKQPDRKYEEAPTNNIVEKLPETLIPSGTPEEITAAEEKKRVARREYDRKRTKIPERREKQRLLAQQRRRVAKETGRCKSCTEPAIPGLTRCETCAESHRQSGRRSDANSKAPVNAKATT